MTRGLSNFIKEKYNQLLLIHSLNPTRPSPKETFCIRTKLATMLAGTVWYGNAPTSSLVMLKITTMASTRALMQAKYGKTMDGQTGKTKTTGQLITSSLGS